LRNKAVEQRYNAHGNGKNALLGGGGSLSWRNLCRDANHAVVAAVQTDRICDKIILG
jgi:hypothetical protein